MKKDYSLMLKKITLISFAIFTAVTILTAIKEANKRVDKSAGIVADAKIIYMTGQRPITQIRTQRYFLVVAGTPIIAIGEQLYVKKEGNSITEIQDANGRMYKVQ